MSILIARVAVDKTLYHFDKLFDYAVPEYLRSNIEIGKRLLVPFGNGNKKRQAITMEFYTSYDADMNLKEIAAVLDDYPLLTSEMVKLVFSMKERFYCTYYDAVKAMLPVGINYRISSVYKLSDNVSEDNLTSEQKNVILHFKNKTRTLKQDVLFKKLGIDCENRAISELLMLGIITKKENALRRVGDASVKMMRINENADENIKLSSRQQDVADLLRIMGSVSVREICYYTGVTQSVTDALVKKGVGEYYDEESFRLPSISYSEDVSKIVLTDEQRKAYQELLEQFNSNKPSVSLLYGVTGAGKTSVFLKLIETVCTTGRGVIVMVPEISLTPQMVALFKGRFGENVAVFHSALSMGERLDEWKRVRQGFAKIAVGTRSAVFAPFENIGLIIMDEEQEYTYKSESSPRYHAREVAKLRCVEHNATLLLSSATPSVESYYYANNGKYSLSKISHRYGKAKLPNVITADMNEEKNAVNNMGFSSVLIDALSENMGNGEQSILLLNRRGYNTFVSCRMCLEVVSCPNCSISLTFHAANNRLMCHYCGFSMKLTDRCPKCGSNALKFSGSGTQRAEQTLTQIFPSARILRLDADSTLAKQAHEKKLSEFRDGKYDILLGTQMVAKGLNFPNVTLVGVLSADQALYSDDYRSYERAFSLLTQVVGRSGRGDKAGRAIIQTYTPENPIIKLSSSQNYQEFYDAEIKVRKAMLYPPFSNICMIGIVSKNEKECSIAAADFTNKLCEFLRESYSDLPIRVLGPSPASIYRVNNKFRYKIIIKFRNSKRFRQMLSQILAEFGKNRKYSDITFYADIDPDNIL